MPKAKAKKVQKRGKAPVKRPAKKPARAAAPKRRAPQESGSELAPISTRDSPQVLPRQEAVVQEVSQAIVEAQSTSIAEVPKEEQPQESAPEEEKEPPVVGPDFSIGESVQFGWNAVTSNLGFFISVFIFWIVLSLINSRASAIGTQLVLSIFNIGITLGYLKLTLDVADGKTPEFKELFSCFGILGTYLLALALYSLTLVAGLILFIIPGIVWGIQFGFYPYALIADRSGPIASLRKSSAITENVKGKLLLFVLALIGVNILGVLALGVGVVVTAPLSAVATAHVYRQLEKQSPQ